MKLVTLYFVLFFSCSILAQDASFSFVAETNKAFVGESIKCTVTLEIKGELHQLVLPQIDDSSEVHEKFEVLEFGIPQRKIETDDEGNGHLKYTQTFTVACFDTGFFSLGPLYYAQSGDSVFSNKISILIEFEPTDNNLGLKDINPLERDDLSAWENMIIFFKKYGLWLLLGILVLVLGYFLLKHLRNRPETITPAVTIPIAEQLMNRLLTIEKDKVWQNNQYKLYYSDLTEVAKKFLEYFYGISTLEKTSKEILNDLKMQAIPSHHYQMLNAIFSTADMAKFAKALPSPQENEGAVTNLKTILNESFSEREKENENQPIESN